MTRTLAGLAATLAWWTVTTAAAPPALLHEAVQIPASSPVVVDGRLTEDVWAQAPSISEFVQREPAEGSAPSQRTDARIAFDETSL